MLPSSSGSSARSLSRAVRGVALGSEGAGLAPFVAADIALPKRGAFFGFLSDPEGRAA